MKRNPFLQFLIGLALLCVGGYWFLNSVSVQTGFYSLRLGSFNIGGGLVIVPFICGVIWLFVNLESMGAKLLTGIGLLLILASIIAGTHFRFRTTSLYEYLVMIVMIFGGLGLLLQVLFHKDKGSKSDKKK